MNEPQHVCRGCQPGQYQSYTGGTNCTDCGHGQFQSQPNSSGCISCAVAVHDCSGRNPGVPITAASGSSGAIGAGVVVFLLVCGGVALFILKRKQQAPTIAPSTMELISDGIITSPLHADSQNLEHPAPSKVVCSCGQALSAEEKFCPECGALQDCGESYIPPVFKQQIHAAPNTIGAFLLSVGLEKYLQAMHDLGCVDVEDLKDIDEEDMEVLGLDALEMGRLRGGTSQPREPTPPAPAATSSQPARNLDELLLSLGLDKYAQALEHDLGCAEICDLDDLDDEDMEKIGMDDAEMGRLRGNMI